MGETIDIAAHLKSAMRRMPSAVALITTRDPASGSPAGLAASAVIPVSMDPPSMLISINTNASAHGAIKAAGRFCINLLGVDDKSHVAVFSDSRTRGERFLHEAWADRSGLPYLAGVPSSIFCEIEQSMVFGTHELFIGRVFDILVFDECEPLGWLEGGFARLGQLAG